MSVQHKPISDALDFSSKPYAHSSWSLQKNAFDNGSSLTISAAGGDISRVLLNNTSRGTHHKEDILMFTLTPTASTNYIGMQTSQIGIQTIQLNTVSGQQIENLQNVNYMLNALTLPQTSFSEFQAFNGAVYGEANSENYIEIAPYTSHLSGATGTDGARLQGGTQVACSCPYQERQYVLYSATSASATPVTNFAFRMKNLPPSIFTIDQICFWNEPLELIITWDNPKNVYFDSTTSDTSGTAIAYAGTTVAVTNLMYYLAVETNPEVNSSLRAQSMSPEGLTILKPHMTSFRQVTPTSTQPSINYNIGSSLGHKLQKIFTVPYAATLTTSNTFDHREVSSAKITSFYSLINNTYTTSIAPVTVANESYMLIKPFLDGSAIGDQSTYNYNWFWCDVFDSDGDRKLYDKSAIDAGMDLTQAPINFQFQATATSASYTWFVFIQTLKKINVSPAGVKVM